MGKLHLLERPATILLIALLSLLMRAHHVGEEFAGYHSWRQTQTQTTILNFAFQDSDILSPRVNNLGTGTDVLRMEFPLMQWLFAWPYRLLGDHPAISRLLTFLLGLLTLFAFREMVLRLTGSALTAGVATVGLIFSPLLYYYSINPLPDNMALMWAMLGLAATVGDRQMGLGRFTVAALFFTLAAACKLPFIVLAAALLPGWLQMLRNGWKTGVLAAVIGVAVLLPTVAWYAWVIPTWQGNAVLTGGWDNPKETFEILKRVWTMVLPEMIMNYANVPFFLIGLWLLFKRRLWNDWRCWPLLATLPFIYAYYFFELHAIGYGHDYYLMPFVPLVFAGVAVGVHWSLAQAYRWRRWVLLPLIVLPITCVLKAEVRWKVSGLNKDLWENAAPLRAMLPMDAKCVVGNDVSGHIFLYHLRRKGWTFKDDVLTAEQLQQRIQEGATHLVTNSPTVEAQAGIAALVGEPVYTSEGVRSYCLRQP
jgi:4-amino-4-deoxy-L-arabinose transferase-like glycosyltransferase